MEIFNNLSIGGGIAVAIIAVSAAYVATVLVREFYKTIRELLS